MGKLFKELQSKHKKGFTLFEVLVVVIILGVLATIALPTYHKVVRKSRVADGLNSLDMLAGAQEKYFMEHGFYAQSMADLKAPFKEYTTEQGTPAPQIMTANFVYSKNPTDNCIKASATTGDYTLLKNYESKEKVKCVGAGCRDIAEYVEEITGGEGDLCPTKNPCPWNQNICGNQHFFASTCTCACQQSEYIQCAMAGGTFTEDCHCTGICAETCEGDQTTAWENTTEVCHGDLGGTGKGIGPGTPGYQEYLKCGIVQERKNCKNNCWVLERQCVKKTCQNGYVLDETDCKCYPPCDPAAQPGCPSTGGYALCDPCPGGDCYHCGYQEVQGQHAECVHGEWHCVGGGNIGTCQDVAEGEFAANQDCDGGHTAGNTCGTQSLVNVSCKQEVEGNIPHLLPHYGDCQLKSGNECFDGQPDWGTCTLPDGGNGVNHCENCQVTCVPETCPLPEPLEYLPSSLECKKYEQECREVPAGSGHYEWKHSGIVWVTDYGEDENGDTLNCVTGGWKACTTADGIQGKRTCTDCKYGDCVPRCDPAEKPQDTNCVTYECQYKSGNWQWSPVLQPTAQCDPNGTFNPANGIAGCNPNTCQVICKGNGVYDSQTKKCYEAYLVPNLRGEVSSTNQEYLYADIHNASNGCSCWSTYDQSRMPLGDSGSSCGASGYAYGPGEVCGTPSGVHIWMQCDWVERGVQIKDNCHQYCKNKVGQYCLLSNEVNGPTLKNGGIRTGTHEPCKYKSPYLANKVYQCRIAED